MADSAEEDVYMLQKTREVLADLREKCTEKSKDSTQYNYAYHLHKAIEHMDYAIAERSNKNDTSPSITSTLILKMDDEVKVRIICEVIARELKKHHGVRV